MSARTSFLTGSSLIFAALVALPGLGHGTDLTQSAQIQNGASYTYYARGDEQRKDVTPFTVKFYPGGTASAPQQGRHGNDSAGANVRDGELEDAEGTIIEAIPFTTGQLTDGVTDGEGDGRAGVAGWINTLSAEQVSDEGYNVGQFDLFFDLGKLCEITKVEVWYGDLGEPHHWVGDQELYAAKSLLTEGEPSEQDLTLVESGAFAPEASGVHEFKAKPFDARYLDLRLRTQVSRTQVGGSGAMGGILYEVRIFGQAKN